MSRSPAADGSPESSGRRQVLGALAATPFVLGLPEAAAAIRTDVLTVLYRPATTSAPNRLDPAVQAAILALEEEFLQRGFQVLQPKPDVYALLDRGPQVVLTFADNAGFSAVFSAYRNLRPQPGQDAGIAEVRLQMRVFVGRHTLVAHEGRGQMFTRLEPGNREFGERRAMELAAQRAAADLAEKTSARLKALTPAQVQEMINSQPTPVTVVAEVPLPLVPVTTAPLSAAPAAAGPTTSSPSPAAPATAPPPPAPALPPPTAGALPAPRARWALLVGVSDYPSLKGPANQASKLPGVKKDLENTEQALRQLGWDPRGIRSLLDEKASGAMVRGYLKQLQSVVDKDDLVLILISAHGAPKQGSLSGLGRPVLADDTGHNDPATLDFWELQGLVRNLSCDRVVLLIDTCHAGGAASNLTTVEISSTGVTAGAAQAGPSGGAMAKQGDPSKHLAIVTASRANEVSGDTANGGRFTVAFLESVMKSKGKEPLGQVMSQLVAPRVLQESREACRRQGPKCEWPQQTPELHYTGRGHLITL